MFTPTHLNPYRKPIEVLYTQCYKYGSMVPGVVYTTEDGWIYWIDQEQFDKYDKKLKSREWVELKE